MAGGQRGPRGRLVAQQRATGMLAVQLGAESNGCCTILPLLLLLVQSLLKSFDEIVRRQLNSIWHTVSPKTKQVSEQAWGVGQHRNFCMQHLLLLFVSGKLHRAHVGGGGMFDTGTWCSQRQAAEKLLMCLPIGPPAQIVADLRTLRTLAGFLLRFDPLTFLTYLHSLRATEGSKSVWLFHSGAQGTTVPQCDFFSLPGLHALLLPSCFKAWHDTYASPSVLFRPLLPYACSGAAAAHAVFEAAKTRVYRLERKGGRKRKAGGTAAEEAVNDGDAGGAGLRSHAMRCCSLVGAACWLQA